MKKKFLLLLLIAMAALPMHAFYDDIFSYNIVSEDENIVEVDGWHYDSYTNRPAFNGTILTFPQQVTYEGRTYDVIGIGYPLSDQEGIKEIIIPEGYRYITKPENKIGVFEKYAELEKVTLPSSLTLLGDSTFFLCETLSEVTINGGESKLEKIGNHAFRLCGKLTGFNIPSTVTEIGDYAFCDCVSLDGIVLPPNLTTLGGSAFSGCSLLDGIVLPPNLTTIGDLAFSRCSSLSYIDIPSSVTYIGYGAFSNTAITRLSIPASVEYFGRLSGVALAEFIIEDSQEMLELGNPEELDATSVYIGRSLKFKSGGFRNIKNVTIGDQVTSIPGYAFSLNKYIETLTIPGSVTQIGWSAFNNMTNLKSLTFLEGEPITLEGGEYYNKFEEISLTKLELGREINVLPTNQTELEELNLNGRAKTIPANLLGNNTKLQNITIPSNITTIGNNAFANCTALTDVTIDISETPLELNNAFPTTIVNLNVSRDWTGSILDRTNQTNDDYNISLTTLNLGDGITQIPGNSFKGATNVKVLNLPGTLTKIGDSAFNSIAITELYIPESVQEIGDNAFSNCTSLDKVYITDSDSPIYIGSSFGTYSSEIYVGRDFSCLSLNSCKSLDFGNKVTTINDNACCNNKLKSLSIPASIQTIGRNAFANRDANNRYSNNTTITELYIEDGDTPIELTGFGLGRCENLYMGRTWTGDSFSRVKTVTIGPNVKAIPDAAFKDAYYLSSISFSEGLTSIGAEAFNLGNSEPRLNITLPNTVTEIGPDAFCGYFENLNIPSGVTEYIGSVTTHVTNLTIEDANENLSLSGNWRVKNLYMGRNTQAQFRYLDYLEFGNNVTSIAASAFCDGEFSNVELPANLTSIGANAFSGCENLYSITIPEGVTYIPQSCFENCALYELTLPSKLETIDCRAFNSNNLNKVKIPGSVTNINEGAFANNGIDDLTFEDNDSENNTLYLSTNSFYSPRRFYSGRSWYSGGITFRNVEELTLSENVKSIPSHAFTGSPISELNLPSRLEEIGEDAFANCNNLTQAIVPPSVKRYGNDRARNAISGTNLYKLAIPDTFKEYASELGNAEYGNVVYPVDANITEDNLIYSADGSTLYFAPIDIEGEYEMPATVTTVVDRAMQYCQGLTDINMSTALDSIGSNAFANSGLRYLAIPPSVTKVGTNLGKNCDSLIKAALPSTLGEVGPVLGNDNTYWFRYDASNYVYDNGFIYSKDYTTLRWAPLNLKDEIEIRPEVTAIGQYAFLYCDDITGVKVHRLDPANMHEDAFIFLYDKINLTVPEVSLGKYMATTWNLFKNIHGSDGTLAETFTDDVFKYRVSGEGKATLIQDDSYKSMSTASIPQRVVYNGKFLTVEAIGYQAFDDCRNLQQLVLPKNATTIGAYAFFNTAISELNIPDKITEIGDASFAYCNSLNTVNIPANVEKLGNNAFNYCSNLETVSLNNNLKEIGKYAFANTSVESITIPDTVEKIAEGTFAYNSYLRSVNLGTGVKDLGVGAFYQCKRLDNVDIPDNVEAIGDKAFYQNTALQSLNIGNGVKTIGQEAFFECTELSTLSIPNSVESIGGSAFKTNTALAFVELGNGVKTIGQEAFAGATALTSLNLGNNVKTIGKQAFLGCGLIEDVVIPNSVDTICEGAFKNNSNLATLDLGRSVKVIENEAFAGTPLMEVTIPASVTDVADAFGNNIKNLTIADSPEPISFKVIPAAESIYLGRNWETSGKVSTRLSELSIGNLVTEIGDEAFKDCYNLKTLHLGSGLKTIGNSAFESTRLTDIVIPASVTSIGDKAFYGNSFSNIDLGHGLTEIGENAFGSSDNTAAVRITAINPPVAHNNTFSYYGCPLYVPQQSYDEELYYNDINCWYRFEPQPLVHPSKIVMTEKIDEESATQQRVEANANADKKISFIAEVYPDNTTLKHIFWASSNPEVATVDLNGNVTIFAGAEGEAEITAHTLYTDGPVASVIVKGDGSLSGITAIGNDNHSNGNVPNDIYNMQGILLKQNATADDIKALSPGIYIIAGKKVLVK